MTRAAVVPLAFLAACTSQVSQVPIGPETTSTVTIETDQSSTELRITPTRPHAHSSVALAPVEQAWAALPGAYAALGIRPAGVQDPAARRYGAGPVTLRRINGERVSRFVDCGSTMSIPNADSYAVTFRIVTQLIPDATGATRVQTVLEATARPRDTAGNTVDCTSTGYAERLIVQKLQPNAPE